MNHIRKLTQENADLRETLKSVTENIIELQAYYGSSKFDGDNGYAYTRTDVLHRLAALKAISQEGAAI